MGTQKLLIAPSSIRVMRNQFGLQAQYLLFFSLIPLYLLVCLVIMWKDTGWTRFFVLPIGAGIVLIYRYAYLPIIEQEYIHLSVEDGILFYEDGTHKIYFPLEKIQAVKDGSSLVERGEKKSWCHRMLLVVELEYAMSQPVLDHLLPEQTGKCVIFVIDTLRLPHEAYIKLYFALRAQVQRSRMNVLAMEEGLTKKTKNLFDVSVPFVISDLDMGRSL